MDEHFSLVISLKKENKERRFLGPFMYNRKLVTNEKQRFLLSLKLVKKGRFSVYHKTKSYDSEVPGNF